MIRILIGVIIWVVLPVFFSSRIKKKSDRKAFSLLCKVIGIAFIGWGIFSYIE